MARKNKLRKRPKKHKFLSFLLFCMWGVMYYKGYLYVEDLLVTKVAAHEVESFIEDVAVSILDYKVTMIEESLNEQSDLVGVTKSEKMAMGLDFSDGSDTDGDGLSDKEEIEVYGTNPKLASTSGDLYLDSYKIENNMDVNQYYTRDNDYRDFVGNDLGTDVSLVAKTATDYYGVITDVTGYHTDESLKIDKEIMFQNYHGIATLDTNSKALIFLDSSDRVIDVNYDEIENCLFEFDASVVEDDVFYVICVEDFVLPFSNSFVSEQSSLNYKVSIDDTDKIGGISSILKPKVERDYILVTMLFLAAFDDEVPIYLFASEPKTDAQRDYDTNLVTTINTEYRDEDGVSAVVEVVYIDNLVYKFVSKLFGSVFSSFDLKQSSDSGDENLQMLGFCWAELSGSELISIADGNEEIPSVDDSSNIDIADSDEGSSTSSDFPIFDFGSSKEDDDFNAPDYFDLGYDALHFGNFSSYISPGGSCAGIGHLIQQVYNGGHIDLVGSYTLPIGNSAGETVSWDLTGTEFKTLSDRGVYDLLPEFEGYGYDLRDSSNTSGAEFELLKYLGAMWAKQNVEREENECKMAGSNYKWSMMESIFNYLDSGKIAYVGMTAPRFAHVVNAYSYERDMFNPFVYYINIYDNNFPDNMFRGEVVPIRMKITKKVNLIVRDGKGDTFEWEYAPFKEYDYAYGLGSAYFADTSHWSDSPSGFSGIVEGALKVYQLSFSDENGELIK